MDLAGHFVMPGLIDMHGHIGGAEQGTPAEYARKLWMGHGITTIRDPPGNGLNFCLDEKKRSAENRITAPRIFAYPFFGQGQDGLLLILNKHATGFDKSKQRSRWFEMFWLSSRHLAGGTRRGQETWFAFGLSPCAN